MPLSKAKKLLQLFRRIEDRIEPEVTVEIMMSLTIVRGASSSTSSSTWNVYFLSNFTNRGEIGFEQWHSPCGQSFQSSTILPHNTRVVLTRELPRVEIYDKNDHCLDLSNYFCVRILKHYIIAVAKSINALRSQFTLIAH